MALVTIQRLMISRCRSGICSERISGLNILRKKTPTIRIELSENHTISKRFLHDTCFLQRNKLKENEVSSKSTLELKKRFRNRTVIKNEKILRSNEWNVKALTTAEEYDLENLAYGLLDQQLYIPSKISTCTNCKYFISPISSTFIDIPTIDFPDSDNDRAITLRYGYPRQ